jgi:hypothetical protein
VVIQHGDVAECRIEGMGSLSNPVRRGAQADYAVLASVGV